MIRSLALAASVFLVFDASLAAAHTVTADEAPTQSVVYRDLNLTSPEGVATLKRRVALAVRSVCGDADSRDLRMQNLVQSCRHTAQAKSDPLVLAAITHAGQTFAGQSDLKVAAR